MVIFTPKPASKLVWLGMLSQKNYIKTFVKTFVCVLSRAADPVSWILCQSHLPLPLVKLSPLKSGGTVTKDHTTGSPSPVADKIKVYLISSGSNQKNALF